MIEEQDIRSIYQRMSALEASGPPAFHTLITRHPASASQQAYRRYGFFAGGLALASMAIAMVVTLPFMREVTLQPTAEAEQLVLRSDILLLADTDTTRSSTDLLLADLQGDLTTNPLSASLVFTTSDALLADTIDFPSPNSN